MVKVATQGAGVKDVMFQEGMKVEDVLREAQMAASSESTVTINGKSAVKDTPVPNESLVVVTGKIANG